MYNISMKIKISQLECKRCGHKWIPRKPEVMLCPKSKTPYWNVEKRKKQNDKNL